VLWCSSTDYQVQTTRQKPAARSQQREASSQQPAARSHSSEVQAAASAAACFPGSHLWLNPSLFAKRENGFRSFIFQVQVNDQIPNTSYGRNQVKKQPAQFLGGAYALFFCLNTCRCILNPETDSRLLTLVRRRKMLGCTKTSSTLTAEPATTK
jgi:hypothetical protein